MRARLHPECAKRAAPPHLREFRNKTWSPKKRENTSSWRATGSVLCATCPVFTSSIPRLSPHATADSRRALHATTLGGRALVHPAQVLSPERAAGWAPNREARSEAKKARLMNNCYQTNSHEMRGSS